MGKQAALQQLGVGSAHARRQNMAEEETEREVQGGCTRLRCGEN